MGADEKYAVNGFDLTKVRNRNEVRVVAAMQKVLADANGFCGCQLCVEDVYALCLNQIPSHYVQSGAIVLNHKNPSQAEIERIAAAAVVRVGSTPNHT
jgi:hypothetical protein